MSTSGPFLYDDEPAPLHTGTPRQRNGWLIGGLLAVVLVAVAMAVVLPLFKGSPEEQAREVVGVFLAALEAEDAETAHGLLCDEEQQRLAPADVAAAYLGTGSGEIAGVGEERTDGEPVQVVEVAWSDGTTSEFSVIPEEGAVICGAR
jgi:hypothetical protein